jgi:hypothetical protein
LVSVYTQAGRELAAELEQLFFSNNAMQKAALYNRITGILARLRKYGNTWAEIEIDRFFKEADAMAAGLIAKAKLPNAMTQWSAVNEEAVRAAVSNMKNSLDPAYTSISNLANRIMRRTRLDDQLDANLQSIVAKGIATGQSQAKLRMAIADKIRKQFSDGIVSIIASNGRQMRFSLDYYAGMVAHQSERQAMSLATITRAQQNGMDLVKVSENPSTINDYCNAYRGKVYSISGTSQTYPALATCPRGGPPFHVWCKHSLAIFIPDFYSEEAKAEAANTNPKYLITADQNEKQIIKNWWADHRG